MTMSVINIIHHFSVNQPEANSGVDVSLAAEQLNSSSEGQEAECNNRLIISAQKLQCTHAHTDTHTLTHPTVCRRPSGHSHCTL